MVRPTPLPSPSSDVGAATARPILTNSKPEPSLHPPICSWADAPLMALCCQRSDLASDTPQAKPALSRKACPDPEIESAWQGHQAPLLPAILPGMGQLQPPRTLSAPSLLLGSWAQPNKTVGGRRQVQTQEGGAIWPEGPPELYLATLALGSSGPTQLPPEPLQLLLQLGTPRSTPVDTAVTCLPQV